MTRSRLVGVMRRSVCFCWCVCVCVRVCVCVCVCGALSECMPIARVQVLRYIVDLAADVAANEDTTQMSAQNMGIVFGYVRPGVE